MLDRPSSYEPTEPEPQGGVPWLQIVVFLALLLVVMLVLIGGNAAQPATLAQQNVTFIEPQDGATVPQTFLVRMNAQGLVVEPSGTVNEGAGHFHILVDTDPIAPGQTIPADEQHIHFGNAAAETELTMPPGDHRLILQFADGAHTALEGDRFVDEIMVNVVEGE